MLDAQRSALIIIDMQGGFIEENSSLHIAGAKSSIPACALTLDEARKSGMHVVHVVRRYATDGGDVEPVRRSIWIEGGKPLSDAWPESLREPEALSPIPGS